MKKLKFIKLGIVISLVLNFSSCNKDEPIKITPNDLHLSIQKVTEIMIHDIFSPPVASRVYVYPNIASYEIIAQKNENYQSLSKSLPHWNGVDAIKVPKNLNTNLAALIAHIKVSQSLMFSEEKLLQYRDSLYAFWSEQNNSELLTAIDYAYKVSEKVLKWMKKDDYSLTRTMPKYSVDLNMPKRWIPTPPAYMDGIEPHWNKIRPLYLKKADQFKPNLPPSFSLKKNSKFYKEVEEVYKITSDITKRGDESEEIIIAKFWDCNPYVSVTRGHLMFALKKITPGAHWIGITKIACKQSRFDFEKTVFAYTAVSIGLFDAFISCWDEKYRSNLVRPETLINQYIDENWKPILQTPPFPEYTSGHSVISATSSVILSHIFGDNYAFKDDTELPYGLPIRSFISFKQAADEAALSRLYGGIHYRIAIDEGLIQGKKIGNYIVNKLQNLKK